MMYIQGLSIPAWYVQVVLGTLLFTTTSHAGPSKHREHACDALSKALPGQVTFPNSPLYAVENSYWSERQAAFGPACFVSPRKTSDVSTAIKILTQYDQRFSVKGGGHAAFPGASNVDNGVTIDLFRLTEIKVSPDRKTVSVGAGNRWINVSEALDPLGLAVVGGRVSDVGVGGLILGGGISYFSGRYGWACDNVRNYEIVLSSGNIVNASPTKNRDLYWALRGGAGTNFGIVTRFDLAAFEQGDIWWRSLIYPAQLNTTLVPVFLNLTLHGLPADPAAHTYFVLTHVPELGGFIILNDQFHTAPPQPSNGGTIASFTPPVFTPFDTSGGWAYVNTTTVTNVSTISRAINQPYGSQQIWMNTAISASSATSSGLLVDIVSLWQSYVTNLLSKVTPSGSLAPFLIFQPISSNILSAMQTNGGNALGLSPSKGPRIIVQLAVTWSDASLNKQVEQATAKLIRDINSLAKKRGLADGFVYMNYAEPSQDVFASYGKENHKKLKEVSKKYDPRGDLKKLWRGYFKL